MMHMSVYRSLHRSVHMLVYRVHEPKPMQGQTCSSVDMAWKFWQKVIGTTSKLMLLHQLCTAMFLGTAMWAAMYEWPPATQIVGVQYTT